MDSLWHDKDTDDLEQKCKKKLLINTSYCRDFREFGFTNQATVDGKVHNNNSFHNQNEMYETDLMWKALVGGCTFLAIVLS